MNKIEDTKKPNVEKSKKSVKEVNKTYKHIKEIKFQESPIERALKISSDEIIALAIRDLLNKDCLN